MLLASEQQIACSSPFVQRGILNYVSHYSDDANLNLWAGLISQRLGQYSQAISELSMAIALGCSHWRALWYLAQTAERAGDLGLARKTLLQLWASHPKMAVVRGTYTRLFNCPVSLLPQRFLLEKALNLLKVLVKSPKHFVKMSLMAIRDRFSILLTFSQFKQ
ncbi:MAG: hypothetical protein HC840_22720 [Leptolyngbyaceae cyanobacterium RM2_2_4]|nr:hypothetical protein [Leptolyngbyaceae cyanobacterium RM2_2_4]